MTRIGKIINYYGGLYVREDDSRFYWVLENWDGFGDWEEIPESLYRELLDFGTEPEIPY